jgi:hypothetical protein
MAGKDCFCFGSNEAGIHGAGAAHDAYTKYGAKWGIGVGHQGNSYAIPTKDKNVRTLPLTSISDYVNDFILYAEKNPDITFYVTKIGCGLAGHSQYNIAPMFIPSLKLDNVKLPRDFLNIISPKSYSEYKVSFDY